MTNEPRAPRGQRDRGLGAPELAAPRAPEPRRSGERVPGAARAAYRERRQVGVRSPLGGDQGGRCGARARGDLLLSGPDVVEPDQDPGAPPLSTPPPRQLAARKAGPRRSQIRGRTAVTRRRHDVRRGAVPGKPVQTFRPLNGRPAPAAGHSTPRHAPLGVDLLEHGPAASRRWPAARGSRRRPPGGRARSRGPSLSLAHPRGAGTVGVRRDDADRAAPARGSPYRISGSGHRR